MKKIPVTILTGFLGSGKTTLLQNLLKQAGAHGKTLGILVNEFGDIGVDGALIQACALESCPDNADVIELPNGCVCCTVADEFLPAMQKLLARPQPLDHIIIETSGLALPQPLVKAFTWPEIRNQLTIDAVITLIDAPAIFNGTFSAQPHILDAQRAADPALDHETPIEELFEDQLRAADLAILTKTDLLSEAQITSVLDTLHHELEHINRAELKIIPVTSGQIAIETVLGFGLATETIIHTRPSHHELEDEDDHDHDDFETLHIPLPAFPSAQAVIDALQAILKTHPIFRAKGFVMIEGKIAPLVVQAVGSRVETYFSTPQTHNNSGGFLVLIGYTGMNRDAITAQLNAKQASAA